MTRASGQPRRTAVAIPLDEPAAADRDDHDVELGQVLEDLERDRPLARDHRRVVERMHERAAGLARSARRSRSNDCVGSAASWSIAAP